MGTSVKTKSLREEVIRLLDKAIEASDESIDGLAELLVDDEIEVHECWVSNTEPEKTVIVVADNGTFDFTITSEIEY